MKPFRGLWTYIKRLNDKTWNFIFKYSSHIYLSMGLIIMFMMFTLLDNMSWADDMNKLRQENHLMRTELERINVEIGEQVDVILIQGRIINEQEGHIRSAEGALRSQDLLIRRLLNLLSGEKLPEPEPLDPDRITRSGDISYENYQSN